MPDFDELLDFWNKKIADKNCKVVHTRDIILGSKVLHRKTVITMPLELFQHPFEGHICVCPTQAHGLSCKAEYFFDELKECNSATRK